MKRRFSWNSSMAKKDYDLHIHTNSKSLYKILERICQRCIDYVNGDHDGDDFLPLCAILKPLSDEEADYIRGIFINEGGDI